MPTQPQLDNDIDLYKSLNPWVFKTIDVSDINLYPYNAYKTWTVYSGSSTSSCLPLNAVYTDIEYLPALETELIYNDSKNIDNSLQSVTYFSINRLFYKNKNNIFFTHGPSNLANTNLFLYESASVLSFPYKKIGDGIKSKSFELSTVTRSININLKSDKYGNIYDTQIDTSSIISDVKFYEGFNEYFDVTRINTKNMSDSVYITGSVSFDNGIPATTGTSQSIGKCISFNGLGSFIINKNSIPGEYNRSTDYAISFFISASSSGTQTQNVITKRPDSNTVNRTPYSITLNSNKKIQFAVIDAMYNGSSYNSWLNPNTTFPNLANCSYVAVTSSTAVSSSWNHVVCQKSGSYLQIYVNGTLQANTYFSKLNSTNKNSGRIDCEGATYIGGWVNPAQTLNNFSGKFDEVRIYNKSLTATEIGYLGNRSETGSMLQTNTVGNIFEKNGIAVITSPNYLYSNILQTPFTASYKSTVTRHELSVLARIGAGDYNMSLNSTLVQDDGVTYLGYISSSADFYPYITTIGLYDDRSNLIAVGKLATPLRKRNDIDTNILIQIDLENTIKMGTVNRFDEYDVIDNDTVNNMTKFEKENAITPYTPVQFNWEDTPAAIQNPKNTKSDIS
jgi:hypothetical protein